MNHPIPLDLRLFDSEGAQTPSTGDPREDAAPDYRTYKKSRTPDLLRDEDSSAEEWADIRNRRFKSRFDADVKAIVQSRLKNAKEAQERLARLEPVLQEIATRYGKDASDLDGLTQAIAGERQSAQNAQAAMKERYAQHLQSLTRQAEALKATYPAFDLRSELHNERFARMTSPQGGLSVAEAFHALHHARLRDSAVRYAVQRTRMEVANAIAAGRSRPAENGSRAANPGIDVRSDPSRLKLEDFRRIREQVNLGERVGF